MRSLKRKPMLMPPSWACTMHYRPAPISLLPGGEFRADLISPVSNNDITYPYYQLFENNRVASVWAQPYNMIGRANVVIEKVPEIPALDNRFTREESNAIVGEALFFTGAGLFLFGKNI